MATIQTINIGTVANDGTGDSARVGADKINQNFTAVNQELALKLVNPMTTVGDVIYGASSGTATRLAGNTTTTKQFLTQTGTGSASQAPAWGTIAGADVTGAILSKTDDTNVTLTLGGSASTALLRAASLTLGWTGTLAVSRGGIGVGTLTGIAIGNGTNAFTAITGTANQLLRRDGTNTAYEFFTPSYLTTAITSLGGLTGTTQTFGNDTNVTITSSGTTHTLGWSSQLSVSRGGTGAATLTGIVVGNATSALTAVVGTANQLLRRNSGNTAYEFFSPTYLTAAITSLGGLTAATQTFSNDTNVTISSNTSTHALGWSGQLAVGRGGTGASTLTGILVGSGTSAIAGVVGTANQLLRRNSGNTAYEFFSPTYLTAISGDTSPQLGGHLNVAGYSIDYGVKLSTDGTYKGDTITVTVDTNAVGFGALLAQAADFNFDEADADAVANCNMLVLALETGTGTKKVLTRGQICRTSWSWSNGAIYASVTQGTLTQTAPSGTDDVVVIVGWALSATSMYFNPYGSYLTRV